MNSCFLYCVFKAFIVEVASCNVSKFKRVRDTHGVCTTSDWLLFSNRHMQRLIFLIALQTQKLIHIRMVIQQLSKSEYIYIFSIALMIHHIQRGQTFSRVYSHIAALTFNPIFFHYLAENLAALKERRIKQGRQNTVDVSSSETKVWALLNRSLWGP